MDGTGRVEKLETIEQMCRGSKAGSSPRINVTSEPSGL